MNEARGILAGTRWRHTTRHRWLVNGSLGFPKSSTSLPQHLETSTCTRRCWSSRCWHSDWKSGLFPDFYRKYSKVRTFPGPGRPCFKISTFPGNKDRVGTMLLVQIIACPLTRQAIIWTTAGILLIGALATNFNEISIKLLHTRLHSIYHDEISTLFLYIELRNSRPNNQVSIKSALD